MGDVAEQMDAEHLLFCPLHWPEILWATKIIFAISTNTFGNIHKYILQFPQKQFAILTNTILDLDNLHWNKNEKQHPNYKNKIQIQNWKGLFGNRLMTEWSLMTNLLQIINRANPSTPLGCQQNNKLSIIVLSLPSKESFSEAA